MNILHMKYAVEIAKAGSINKASEALLTAQPNLSRALKELEADLGIVIFDRSSKGMVLTPDGEEFIANAEKILERINEFELMYKGGEPRKQRFSVSVPRACYINEAFSEFTKGISDEPAEIIYREANSRKTINSILQSEYKLGIIRYTENHDRYFKNMLSEKGIAYEPVSEFSPLVVISAENPLAEKPAVSISDLEPYIEIAYADSYIPADTLSAEGKREGESDGHRKIFVHERGTRLNILSHNPKTYSFSSPVPKGIMESMKVVQKRCTDGNQIYRDLLIYRRDHELTELDRLFMKNLKAAVKLHFLI